MRLFGGSQVDTLLTRFKFDENMPIEASMIARLVEQRAQTRVEGFALTSGFPAGI